MKRSALTALAVLLLSLIGASAALAHAGKQSYLYLDVAGDDVGGRLEMPFSDLREVLGLQLGGSTAEIEAELEAAAEQLESYAADHVTIGADGQRWPLTFDGVARLEAANAEDPSFGYAQVFFTAETPAEGIPRQLEITLDPFFDEIADRDALLLIGNHWEAGVIDNEEDVLLRFTPDTRTQSVDLGERSWWRNVQSSMALGLDHIKTGPDHILFILVLLLPSVLVFRAGWQPTDSFFKSFWRVLKVVTMFTVAHTVTFTLAGLDVLPLPSPRLTETVIALSIAAAALHNLRPVLVNREWLLAFAFGLFHGMGFASLVSSLDVDRSTQLVSLLGRNLGIEIGQTIVVLLLFPGLFLLRRTRWYSPFFIVGSLALTAISLAWVAARLFDTRDLASPLVGRLMEYPRVLILVAVFTIVAALLARRTQRAEGLDATSSEPA